SDEQWNFEMARRTVQGEGNWPWIGMLASVGIENPGLSTWPFIGLACLFRTPEGMTLGVMIINAVWLLGLALWVRSTWAEEHRWWGVWAIALFAVSPLPILFSRKLWTPDLLPLLLLPCLWTHARRREPRFAFLWGFVGMLMGQLQMAGFFAAAGLAAGSWITDRKEVKWVPWAWGSVLGILPMFPWIWYELHQGRSPRMALGLSPLFLLQFYRTAFGLGLEDFLGSDHATFAAGPVVAGVSTALVSGIEIALLGLAIYGTLLLWVDRRSLTFPIGQRPLLWGALIGAGLLQIVCPRINLYYLVAWSPVLHIGAAWMFARRPRLLVATAGLQMCLSLTFLLFIHEHGGAPGGDYGVTYRRQHLEPASTVPR
ncbi:MAG TPA: hypothetical protein VKW04_05505, partial [Planctomycetota bacterium]|nr:hypothetical protein [Planctomycetota bacterium]